MRWASMMVLLLLCAAAAHADNKQVARDAYREGARFYDLADFDHALESFKKAYLAQEEPSLLYNIAQCYKQLGNKPEALRFYRTFLRKVPTVSNADEVRRMIEALEQAIAQEKDQEKERAKASAPPPVVETPTPIVAPTPPTVEAPPPVAVAEAPAASPRRPLHKKWWFWTVIAVGVIAVAGGVTGGVLATQQTERTAPAVRF